MSQLQSTYVFFGVLMLCPQLQQTLSFPSCPLYISISTPFCDPMFIVVWTIPKTINPIDVEVDYSFDQFSFFAVLADRHMFSTHFFGNHSLLLSPISFPLFSYSSHISTMCLQSSYGILDFKILFFIPCVPVLFDFRGDASWQGSPFLHGGLNFGSG